MIDNGSTSRSRYGEVLRLLKIKHLRTKALNRETSGKAERSVQTGLRE
jgi:hypothetical protein